MLDIKFIVNNKSLVIENLKKRGNENIIPYIEKLEEIYEKRNKLIQETDSLKAERNQQSKLIAKLKKEGKDVTHIFKEMKELKQKIETLDKELNFLEERKKELLLGIPNILDERVPYGKDETQNVVVRMWGKKPDFDFKPRTHWEIAEKTGIIDFKRAVKLAGSRFALYKGLGAKLERALISFMLYVHLKEHGYTEFLPPFIVNSRTMTGTGQLPKFKEDLFKIEGYDYYLIPTAEVPLTNIHAEEILDEDMLPLYYTAYTPCFRSEAGSYGKDVRGLIRQHQFNKVELVKVTKPEDSFQELEKLTRDAEEILRRLNLHYRVISLCTGDLGFSSAKTYDLEVWLPGQGVYKEISSCSNCTDFQARRARIRFRRKGKKGTEFVHTLNGSGLAVGRTLVAILENYQQEDGSIRIPEALVPYMDDMEYIRPGG